MPFYNLITFEPVLLPPHSWKVRISSIDEPLTSKLRTYVYICTNKLTLKLVSAVTRLVYFFTKNSKVVDINRLYCVIIIIIIIDRYRRLYLIYYYVLQLNMSLNQLYIYVYDIKLRCVLCDVYCIDKEGMERERENK